MTTGEVREVLDSHQRRRPLRVVAYVLLSAGAGVLMADPTQSIQAADQDLRTWWAGLLLAGALGGIYGAWTDKYFAEFVTLPLLMAGFGGFVAVLFARGTSGPIAFGCFLLALVVIMFSRWMDLWLLTGLSTRAERKRRGGSQ